MIWNYMINKEINVYNEVGGKAAVSDEDGQKLFDKINSALASGYIVILNFINIEIVIPAFLHVTIGQLYKEDYDVEFIKTNLKITNLSNSDTEMLETVLVRANEYYRNPEYKQNLEAVLKEELHNS